MHTAGEDGVVSHYPWGNDRSHLQVGGSSLAPWFDYNPTDVTLPRAVVATLPLLSNMFGYLLLSQRRCRRTDQKLELLLACWLCEMLSVE